MPKASPQAIRNLASAIDELRSTFAGQLAGVGATTIAAGAFGEADNLSAAVSNGAVSLDAEAATIDAALARIVTNLNVNAQYYADAEADNAAASAALHGLILALDSVFVDA